MNYIIKEPDYNQAVDFYSVEPHYHNSVMHFLRVKVESVCQAYQNRTPEDKLAIYEAKLFDTVSRHNSVRLATLFVQDKDFLQLLESSKALFELVDKASQELKSHMDAPQLTEKFTKVSFRITSKGLGLSFYAHHVIYTGGNTFNRIITSDTAIETDMSTLRQLAKIAWDRWSY